MSTTGYDFGMGMLRRSRSFLLSVVRYSEGLVGGLCCWIWYMAGLRSPSSESFQSRARVIVPLGLWRG